MSAQDPGGSCETGSARKSFDEVGVPLRISPDNPWYWEYKGKPVLLLGGSDEDNLFNHPALMAENLDALAGCGGNYIRATLSSRDPGNVAPYEKVGGVFDLYRFNREYWERLEACVNEAEARSIVVQVEIWATFDFYGDPWAKNPFNPGNNINYTTTNTALQERWPYHPARKPQPFFSTVPALDDDRDVLKFQKAFVDKVLDVTLSHENVLYCLDNETAAAPEWAWFWGEYVARESARRGFEANVTEMWDSHDLRSGGHANTYSRPDIFNYLDISQNNWREGAAHWDNIMWLREELKRSEAGPRPMNNVKVYARSESGGLDIQTVSERFWQNILAGCASTRFHRPTDGSHGIGLNSNARAIIAAARTFTDAFDVTAASPARTLLSNAPATGAYAMANVPDAYAVYLPEGGQVTLDLSGSAPAMVLRWFDPRENVFYGAKGLPGGRPVTLVAPSDEWEWVALVQRG